MSRRHLNSANVALALLALSAGVGPTHGQSGALRTVDPDALTVDPDTLILRAPRLAPIPRLSDEEIARIRSVSRAGPAAGRKRARKAQRDARKRRR